MVTYKCKYCTHETISNNQPSECEICGSSSLVLIDSIDALEMSTAIDTDKLFWVYGVNCIDPSQFRVIWLS
jgi:hypothetical protein